jgi:hypothetical protein
MSIAAARRQVVRRWCCQPCPASVIEQLSGPERLLILGPGEAKGELERRFRRSKVHAGCAVDVETADKLTNPQIVARVKEHFGIER